MVTSVCETTTHVMHIGTLSLVPWYWHICQVMKFQDKSLFYRTCLLDSRVSFLCLMNRICVCRVNTSVCKMSTHVMHICSVWFLDTGTYVRLWSFKTKFFFLQNMFLSMAYIFKTRIQWMYICERTEYSSMIQQVVFQAILKVRLWLKYHRFGLLWGNSCW